MQYKILCFPLTVVFGNTENTVYPTLLWDEHSIILIDCGFTDSFPILEAELNKHGLLVEMITGLVLTHHDHDHMGAAAELKRRNPQLQIYASAKEAPFISAEKKPLRLCQAEEMQNSLPPEQQDFGKAFCEMLRRVEPVGVDELFQDRAHKDWCGGCRIISTPGHTLGHISLLMDTDSIVITGDAIALEDGLPVIANPQFALNLEQAAMSMEKLLELKAKTYFCYHGGVYSLTD